MKLARDLDGDLAATGIALRAGEISADHAQVIARAVRDLPKEAGRQTRAAAEQFLLDQARVFHPKDLARLGRKVLEVVDPELADRVLAKQFADEEAKAEREREIVAVRRPVQRVHLAARQARPVHHRDVPDRARTTRQADADRPRTGPTRVTPAQRLGDGFAELLRRYLTAGASPTQGGERPHVVITIDHDKLRDGTGTANAAAHRHPGLGAHRAGVRLRRQDQLVHPRQQARRRPGNGTGGAGLSDPSGSTPARPADSSNSGTAAAPSPAATAHHPGPTPTTSSPGAAADPPPSTTASCSAATTTDSSTKDTGPSPSPTTANQNSPHPTGSTPTASHSATTHSAPEER